FVSTATENPREWSAVIAASSSWSRGSPPVHTTKRSEDDSCGQRAATASASASAVANLPPSAPTPTKSVSQKSHTADARSASRPVQRLHPANRQNTAALPEFAPSPWRV